MTRGGGAIRSPGLSVDSHAEGPAQAPCHRAGACTRSRGRRSPLPRPAGLHPRSHPRVAPAPFRPPRPRGLALLEAGAHVLVKGDESVSDARVGQGMRGVQARGTDKQAAPGDHEGRTNKTQKFPAYTSPAWTWPKALFTF